MGKRTLREIGGKCSRLKDESEWYKIPNHHPAIIDKAVFEQVQSQIKRFTVDKKPKDYPLKGKVICGCCKHSMQQLAKSPSFRCMFTKMDENAVCNGLKIKRNELETMLFEIISKQARIILNTDSLRTAGKLDERLAQKKEYERLIEDCYNKKQSLYEQYVFEKITPEEYKSQKSVLDTETKRLRQTYSVLSAEATQLQSDRMAQRQMLNIAEDIKSETALTQTLADALINKVYVYPGDNIEIEWSTPSFFC